MGLWNRLVRTLRPDRRDRDDDEIDEEIQFHLAMKQRDLESAREARLRFGHPATIRVETRAAGVVLWLESLLHDARYSIRQLRKTPVITLAVVVSLTIGIGANTAMFGLVDATLVRPMPVPDPDSLVNVRWATRMGPPERQPGYRPGEPPESIPSRPCGTSKWASAVVDAGEDEDERGVPVDCDFVAGVGVLFVQIHSRWGTVGEFFHCGVLAAGVGAAG
jgi:hypothetical protein